MILIFFYSLRYHHVEIWNVKTHFIKSSVSLNLIHFVWLVLGYVWILYLLYSYIYLLYLYMYFIFLYMSLSWELVFLTDIYFEFIFANLCCNDEFSIFFIVFFLSLSCFSLIIWFQALIYLFENFIKIKLKLYANFPVFATFVFFQNFLR